MLQVIAWARSMEGIQDVVKAVNQMKELDGNKDAFARFLDTGRLPSKKLRQFSSVPLTLLPGP